MLIAFTPLRYMQRPKPGPDAVRNERLFVFIPFSRVKAAHVPVSFLSCTFVELWVSFRCDLYAFPYQIQDVSAPGIV